jgi:hypothetical protein
MRGTPQRSEFFTTPIPVGQHSFLVRHELDVPRFPRKAHNLHITQLSTFTMENCVIVENLSPNGGGTITPPASTSKLKQTLLTSFHCFSPKK